MVKADKKPVPDNGWKGSIKKVYLYILYFLIIYALWIGLRMGEMLSRGEEVPTFLTAAHTHILCISFLLLFLLFDLRIKKRLENLEIHWGLGEIIIGAGLIGLILTTIGFTLAGLFQNMMDFGLLLSGIGEPLVLYSLLTYAIAAMIEEMYK
jgi:hypothetical protein